VRGPTVTTRTDASELPVRRGQCLRSIRPGVVTMRAARSYAEEAERLHAGGATWSQIISTWAVSTA
jgi:hypothetical protein